MQSTQPQPAGQQAHPSRSLVVNTFHGGPIEVSRPRLHAGLILVDLSATGKARSCAPLTPPQARQLAAALISAAHAAEVSA